MRVLAISGSPRTQGNTFGALSHILDLFETRGGTCSIVELAPLSFGWCDGCGACRKTKKCVVNDDLQEVYSRAVAADVLVLGSPVYGGSMAAPMKTMLDRFSWWSSADDRAFEKKLGVPVVTGRRGGLNSVHAELLMWMYIRGFLVIGAYWNICFAGTEKGAWDADTEFKKNAVRIVENTVWVHERIQPRVC